MLFLMRARLRNQVRTASDNPSNLRNQVGGRFSEDPYWSIAPEQQPRVPERGTYVTRSVILSTPCTYSGDLTTWANGVLCTT